MEKCEYCKGTGFTGTGFIERVESGHRVIYPHTEPCYCRINKSIGKKFGILSPVSFPPPVDTNKIHKIYGGRDLIFYGSEDLYLYILKCFFMKGFMYRNYLVLEGGTIVEKYNVPSKEGKGDWLTTSHLNQYDMLGLMFTTSARYASLKDSTLEVIKNRSRLAKPTWIYALSEDKLKGANEYTADMEIYFADYRKINLSKIPKLKGFSPRKIALDKKANNINDDLGGS